MPRKKGMATGLSPVKRLTPAEDSQRQPSPASAHPPPRRKVTTSSSPCLTSLLPPVAPGGEASSGLDISENALRSGALPSRSMTPHGEDLGDLRYRHKKFKKMATTVGVADDLSSSAATSDTGWESPSPSEHSKSSPSPTASVNGTSGTGRYVCPYCKMACAKPSVLQKHIRAHTNERPYPCVPCGFAFKTKSNLYKHRRSRAHLMKAGGRDETGKLILEHPESSSEMVATPSMSVSDADEEIDEDGSPLCPTPETPPLSAPQFLNSIPGAAYSPPSVEKPLRPGIYKPKFHTALYDSNAAPLENNHDPELPTSSPSSPNLSRKISLTSPLCYSPGAPSPEVIHRHINKLISENEAIVDTRDPLWNRRYSRQHSNRGESRSPEPQNLAQTSWPNKKFYRQVSAGPCLTGGRENKSSMESISSSTPPPHSIASQANSRLALALLRPKQDECSPPVMTLQGGATVTLEVPNNKIPPQPVPAPSPHQPLNLSVNNHISNNNNQQHHHVQPHQDNSELHRKRCISDSVAVAPTGVRELLVNYWSQQPHKLARFMADCSPGDKNFHPQNPEGSIIKDLLLKARGGMDVTELLNNAESNAAALYTMGDDLHPSCQAFVCNLCKISYRNAENLEIHQRYYCKGLEQNMHLKEDSRRTPKSSPHPSSSPRSTPRSKSREDASKMAAAVELVALATPPPFPSPGPLLGSTPLVGGYNSSKEESPPLKKRRVHSVSEDRPPSTGSLRSLEELSRSPMSHHRPNSLQMFGGKVHINDGAETKTMIIDPSRGAPNSSSLLSMPNINNDDGRGDNSDNRKSPTNIVVTIARSNLNSGGTIVQKAGHSSSSSTSCTSVSYSVSSITSTLVPDQQLLAAVSRPIVPKITTPSLAPTLQHHLSPFIASHMAKMTAYNPLTLPSTNTLSTVMTPQRPRSPDGVVTILHGGREIPYVPGMPGPQSLVDPRPLDLACSPTVPVRHITEPPAKRHHPAQIPILLTPSKHHPLPLTTMPPSSSLPEPPSVKIAPSPPPPPPVTPTKMVPPKSPIIPSIKVEAEPSLSVPSCLVTPSISTVTSTTSTAATTVMSIAETSESSNKKFLRPNSLPLKPGTYTLKKPSSLTSLSGTTLISPETPRPRKSYGQLYLNGHAYTYLGLKCSTRVFFCCLNQPQPMYVPQSTAPRLSMYSNWKVCAPSIEPPSELVGSPDQAIALYDSRHRPAGYTVARSRELPLVITHSSQWKKGQPPKAKSDVDNSKSKDFADESTTSGTKISSAEGTSSSSGESAPKRVKIFAGGFESNEEYTYVRGRGRGRYVCEECGIRCKKPSMLKKHIRTHTDVRPFTCKHCSFSFKTKGNLTKHMKSKAHYKKCVELGIVPVPTVVDDSYIDEESLAKQQALRSARGEDAAESESEEDEEDEEEDDEDEEEEMMTLGEGENGASRPEREAACSLLSLSEQHAGLIPISVRPSTYPYSYGPPSSTSIAHTPTIVGPVSAHSEREKVSRNTRLAGPPGGTPKSSAAPSSTGRVVVGDSSRYYFPSRRDQSSPPSNEKSSEGYERSSTVVTLTDEVSRSASVVSATSNLSATPPPMDLSRTSTQQQPSLCMPHTPVTPVPDSAALLAALCSTVERLPAKLPSAPTTAETPAETTMLQAYLTERALQDVRIKQHQVHRWKGYNVHHGSAASTPTTPTTPMLPHSPLIWSGQSTVLTPTLTNVPSTILLPSPIKKFSPETLQKSFTEIPKVEITTSVSVLTTTVSSSAAMPVSSISELSHKPVVSQSESTSRKLIAIGQQHVAAAAAAVAAAGGSPPHSSSPGKPRAEFLPPSCGPSSTYASVTEDGKSICVICNKVFSKPSQLRLHVNIHYFERPFRCESCAVSFRTKGHLQKHERSVSHQNKVSMNSTFGMPTTDNPRPFKCEDCKIAFRIHGHLAKHLRSKMHIMKLECLGKLPFGTYAEMERSGVNLNEIDTTDCDNSLESLQHLAQRLYENDPSKLQQWDPRIRTTSESSEDIDDIGEPYSSSVMAQNHLAAMAGNASSGEEGRPMSQSRLSQHMSGSDYEETSDGETEAGQELQHLNCPACEQSFPSLGSLKVHMFVEHDSVSSKERSAVLQDTRTGSSSPGQHQTVLPPVSNEECGDIESRRYRCDLCGLLLRNQEALQSHVASHAQPRPFVCEFCDAGFTSKTLLLGHLALHQASGSPHAPITAATNCSF